MNSPLVKVIPIILPTWLVLLAAALLVAVLAAVYLVTRNWD